MGICKSKEKNNVNYSITKYESVKDNSSIT